MKQLLVLFLFGSFFCRAQGDNDMREFFGFTTAATAKELKLMDKEIAHVNPVLKTITGKQYKNCRLLYYSKGRDLRKITLTRQVQGNNYVTDYYFSSGWPVYVEERNLSKHSTEKFYFDKSNLMLHIDARGRYLTVSDKATSRRWTAIINDIQRWQAIGKLSEKTIDADKVELK
jgi:hypothetical protein